MATSRSIALNISFSGGQPGFPPPVHFQSDGTEIPIDAGFRFELGTFGAFNPTNANTDEWLENWTPILDSAGEPLPSGNVEFTSIASAFGPYTGFVSQVVLDHSNAPFAAGTKAFVWGFDNRTETGAGQWILLGNSEEWLFGDGGSPLSPSMTLTVGNADPAEVKVGSLSGASMLLGAVTVVGVTPPSISIVDLAASESSGAATVTVELSEASSSEVQVAYETQALSATSASDYTAASGTLVIPAGEMSATLQFALENDTDPEADEVFFVVLSSPVGGVLEKANSAVTIRDDDAPAMLVESGSLVVNAETGSLEIHWSSVAGRGYGVLYSHDLVNWEPLPESGPIAADGASSSVALPSDPERCFYKIVDLATIE